MMGKLQNAPAADVLKRYWESAGVSFQGLRLIDGSGLARATMIRPIDLAKVNHAARHAANGDRFLQSLSKELNGKVSSKRGAMSGVRTEVGFFNQEGREFTFALMANGLPATIDFWKLRGSLLEKIGK
jgi:D-alanyl-D-alanine carboxypeptidase